MAWPLGWGVGGAGGLPSGPRRRRRLRGTGGGGRGATQEESRGVLVALTSGDLTNLNNLEGANNNGLFWADFDFNFVWYRLKVHLEGRGDGAD